MRSRSLNGQNLMFSRRQRGVATLVISLVVLMLSTFVVFNVSKAILMEQKISNNDTRAKQAFEAAEAGMNVALDYLNDDPNRDGIAGPDPVFDLLNNDGIGDSATTTIGRSTVEVTYSNINGICPSGSLTTICVTSTGRSDDRTAIKSITQFMVTINPLPSGPQNPVIVRGGVVVGGSATVRNPEGFSTVWSGSDVDLGGNGTHHTEVPNINAANYPACMDIPETCATLTASNQHVIGVDVIENDASLAALSDIEFFQNFFGLSPTTYRSSMVTIETTDASVMTEAQNAFSEVIWLEGVADIQGNLTVGSPSKPSIFIINGDASIQGNITVYGVLFIRGDANITGSVDITGSVVVAGDANVTGSLDIVYSSSAVNNTSLAGNATGGSGSWRDFN